MSDKLVANLRHVGGLADTLAGLRVVVFDEVDLILTHRVWVCRQTPRRGSSRDCLAVELTRRDRQTAGGPSKATASNMPRPYGGPARHRRTRETACPFPPSAEEQAGSAVRAASAGGPAADAVVLRQHPNRFCLWTVQHRKHPVFVGVFLAQWRSRKF